MSANELNSKEPRISDPRPIKKEPDIESVPIPPLEDEFKSNVNPTLRVSSDLNEDEQDDQERGLNRVLSTDSRVSYDAADRPYDFDRANSIESQYTFDSSVNEDAEIDRMISNDSQYSSDVKPGLSDRIVSLDSNNSAFEINEKIPNAHKSIIECGEEITDGTEVGRRYEKFSQFFGKNVEVFYAISDPQRRPLYRPHELAKKFRIHSSRIGMYLNRKRNILENELFQATGFLNKSPNRMGIKNGAYFLTEKACEILQKWADQRKPRTNTIPKSNQLSNEYIDPTTGISVRINPIQMSRLLSVGTHSPEKFQAPQLLPQQHWPVQQTSVHVGNVPTNYSNYVPYPAHNNGDVSFDQRVYQNFANGAPRDYIRYPSSASEDGHYSACSADYKPKSNHQVRESVHVQYERVPSNQYHTEIPESIASYVRNVSLNQKNERAEMAQNHQVMNSEYYHRTRIPLNYEQNEMKAHVHTSYPQNAQMQEHAANCDHSGNQLSPSRRKYPEHSEYVSNQDNLKHQRINSAAPTSLDQCDSSNRYNNIHATPDGDMRMYNPEYVQNRNRILQEAQHAQKFQGQSLSRTSPQISGYSIPSEIDSNSQGSSLHSSPDRFSRGSPYRMTSTGSPLSSHSHPNSPDHSIQRQAVYQNQYSPKRDSSAVSNVPSTLPQNQAFGGSPQRIQHYQNMPTSQMASYHASNYARNEVSPIPNQDHSPSRTANAGSGYTDNQHFQRQMYYNSLQNQTSNLHHSPPILHRMPSPSMPAVPRFVQAPEIPPAPGTHPSPDSYEEEIERSYP